MIRKLRKHRNSIIFENIILIINCLFQYYNNWIWLDMDQMLLIELVFIIPKKTVINDDDPVVAWVVVDIAFAVSDATTGARQVPVVVRL